MQVKGLGSSIEPAARRAVIAATEVLQSSAIESKPIRHIDFRLAGLFHLFFKDLTAALRSCALVAMPSSAELQASDYRHQPSALPVQGYGFAALPNLRA